MTRLATIAILLTVCATSLLAQEPPQNAVYRLKLNQPYKYVLEMKSDIIQEMMGEQQNMSLESTGSCLVTADKYLEGGDTHVNLKIESALVMVESPQGTQSMGSDLKDKVVPLTLLANGRLVDRDSAIKSFQAEQMTVVAQLLQLFPRLEKDAMAAGSTWDRNQADTIGTGDDQIISNGNMKFTIKGKKTVKGHECLDISYSGTVSSSGKMSRGGMDLKVKGEQSRTGSIAYDAVNGLLIEMTYDEKGDQVINDAGGTSLTVNVTSTGSGKVEYMP